MDVTYIDISSVPRRKAGEGTKAKRQLATWLLLSIPSMVAAAVWFTRNPQEPASVWAGIALAAAVLLPIGVLAVVVLRRLRANRVGVPRGERRRRRRALRWLQWRLDRSAGYPRLRRLVLGRLLFWSAPAMVVACILWAAIADRSNPARTPLLVAGILSAAGLALAGRRVLAPVRRDLHMTMRSWSLRLVGALLIAAAVLSALLTYSAIASLYARREAPWYVFLPIMLVGVVLTNIAYEKYAKMRTRARALTHPQTVDIRRGDRRQPILLLRSFPDDARAVAHEMASASDEPWVWALEEALQARAGRFGPFIAVAEPGIGVTGGAARDRFEGDAWRPAVQGWMDEAFLVILIAGWTKGVQWELNEVVRRGHAGKLLLILPDGPELADRWRHVCASFVGTRWHGPMLGADVRPALAVCFREGGNVVLLASRAKSAGHYMAAVDAALYQMKCQA